MYLVCPRRVFRRIDLLDSLVYFRPNRKAKEKQHLKFSTYFRLILIISIEAYMYRRNEPWDNHRMFDYVYKFEEEIISLRRIEDNMY